jgi:hypothetical protein
MKIFWNSAVANGIGGFHLSASATIQIGCNALKPQQELLLQNCG